MKKADIREYLGEYFKKPKGKWNILGWVADHWILPAGQFLWVMTALLVNKVGDLLLMESFLVCLVLIIYFGIAKGK